MLINEKITETGKIKKIKHLKEIKTPEFIQGGTVVREEELLGVFGTEDDVAGEFSQTAGN